MNLRILPRMLQMNIAWWAVLPSPLHSLWTTPKCFTQPQITHYKDNKPNLIAFCLWNYVLIYSKHPHSALVRKIHSFSMHVDWVMRASAGWSEPPSANRGIKQKTAVFDKVLCKHGSWLYLCEAEEKKAAPNNPYLVFFLFSFIFLWVIREEKWW